MSGIISRQGFAQFQPQIAPISFGQFGLLRPTELDMNALNTTGGMAPLNPPVAPATPTATPTGGYMPRPPLTEDELGAFYKGGFGSRLGGMQSKKYGIGFDTGLFQL